MHEDPDFSSIIDFLNAHKRFLITVHESPDGDALGSALGLFLGLKTRKKNCILFCKDKAPSKLLFLPGIFLLEYTLPSFPVDAIIGLDYGSLKRLAITSYQKQFPSVPFIGIDHHPQSMPSQLSLIAPEVSSSSELVSMLLQQAGIPISQSIAICLLTGIFSDTGGFCHVCTSPTTLRIVSDLLRKGVSIRKIAKKITGYYSHVIPALGTVIARLKIDPQSHMAYSWLSYEEFQKFLTHQRDMDGIANLLLMPPEAKFSIFLVESKPGFIEANLRSEPFKGMMVHTIAQALGGGGHFYAAGFRQNGTIEDVLQKVKVVAFQTIR